MYNTGAAARRRANGAGPVVFLGQSGRHSLALSRLVPMSNLATRSLHQTPVRQPSGTQQCARHLAHRRAGRRAGCHRPPLPPTFAVNFLRNGGSVLEASRICSGHERMDTVRIYANWPGRSATAAALLVGGRQLAAVNHLKGPVGGSGLPWSSNSSGFGAATCRRSGQCRPARTASPPSNCLRPVGAVQLPHDRVGCVRTVLRLTFSRRAISWLSKPMHSGSTRSRFAQQVGASYVPQWSGTVTVGASLRYSPRASRSPATSASTSPRQGRGSRGWRRPSRRSAGRPVRKIGRACRAGAMRRPSDCCFLGPGGTICGASDACDGADCRSVPFIDSDPAIERRVHQERGSPAWNGITTRQYRTYGLCG